MLRSSIRINKLARCADTTMTERHPRWLRWKRSAEFCLKVRQPEGAKFGALALHDLRWSRRDYVALTSRRVQRRVVRSGQATFFKSSRNTTIEGGDLLEVQT